MVGVKQCDMCCVGCAVCSEFNIALSGDALAQCQVTLADDRHQSSVSWLCSRVTDLQSDSQRELPDSLPAAASGAFSSYVC